MKSSRVSSLIFYFCYWTHSFLVEDSNYYWNIQKVLIHLEYLELQNFISVQDLNQVKTKKTQTTFSLSLQLKYLLLIKNWNLQVNLESQEDQKLFAKVNEIFIISQDRTTFLSLEIK